MRQIIYREYLVFRGSSICCSLAFLYLELRASLLLLSIGEELTNTAAPSGAQSRGRVE